MSFSMDEDPYALVRALQSTGQRRGYVVFHPPSHTSPVVSSSALDPIATYLTSPSCLDFDEHEGMYFEVGRRSGALLGVFLHKTLRGAAGGGIRLRAYDTVRDYIFDGLRLAIGMGRKSALTGLWHGGGKGVIAEPKGVDVSDIAFRQRLFQDYGEFLTSLRGCYNAAEDSGVTVKDMDIVYSHSRFVTCISPRLGGSGNPSVPTAKGVTMAMEAAAQFIAESGHHVGQENQSTSCNPLNGMTVAVQGCGNVGRPLIRFLLEKGVAKVVAAEAAQANFDKAREAFASYGDRVELKKCEFGDKSILLEEVDIVSPNAWGGVLDKEICEGIQAKIVCGAANSQLLEGTEAEIMRAKGVVYVPDFVANPMGIVNCANEMYGRVGKLGTEDDPQIAMRLGKVFKHSVFNTTLAVLRGAASKGVSTDQEATTLANELMKEPHPLW